MERSYAKWFLPALIVVAIGIVLWDISKTKVESVQIEKQISEAYQNGDWKKAIQLLEDTLKKQPNRNKDLRYSLIQIYVELNLLSQARQHLEICMESLGKAPELQLMEAQILLKEGQKDKVHDLFMGMIKENPEFLPPRIGIVELAMEKKDFTTALAQIEEIKKNFPEILGQIAHIFLSEADIYFYLENFQKAKETLMTFLKIYPNVFGVQRDLIDAMTAMGELSEAQKIYKDKAASAKEKELLFYQQLYALTLPPQESIALLENLLQKDKSPSIKMALTSLWTKEGEYQKAIIACNELKGIPEVVEEKRLSWLGHALYLSGSKDEAKKMYEEILKNPNARSYSLTGLINLELCDKNFPLAMEHIESLIQGSQNEQERLNTEMLKARIHYEANQFEEALKITQKILDETPSGIAVYSHAWYKKAQIFLSQEKYKDASEIFQKIAEKQARVSDLRLKAALWHGIALYLNGEDPIPVWEKYKSFPWQNYMVDDRMKVFLELFTSKENPENMAVFKKLPFFANDTCYFTGLYYEMQNNKEKACENYEEGIQSSLGCDFPWYELLAGKKRTGK